MDRVDINLLGNGGASVFYIWCRKMREQTQKTLLLLLIISALIVTVILVVTYKENPHVVSYHPNSGVGSYKRNAASASRHSSPAMQQQRRAKEGRHDILNFGRPESTVPPEYNIEDEDADFNDKMKVHSYYDMTVYSRDPESFNRTYVEVDRWIRWGRGEGQVFHTHLDDAHRRVADVQLNDFPYYGHWLQNMTIATGGFLFVGDQTRSWLAANQYIAPLMANFDTMENNSKILYGYDGKRMIVEWHKVTLRDNRRAGPFTFQVQLWRNGNINFVYKEVPIPVANISDSQHPCKLGISDAYLFTHKMSIQHKKWVIMHKYQQITIPGGEIGPNTVVVLKALPTCLANSCEECLSKKLKQFTCSWCNPKEGKPFCSDQNGLHPWPRQRIEGNCQIQGEEEEMQCKVDNVTMSIGNSESLASNGSFVQDGSIKVNGQNRGQ